LRDLGKTAQVMARFGPRLPGLVEAALIRQATAGDAEPRPSRWAPLLWMGLGAVTGAGGTIAAMIFLG
jgi:ubiquinone biosynthesis protein